MMEYMEKVVNVDPSLTDKNCIPHLPLGRVDLTFSVSIVSAWMGKGFEGVATLLIVRSSYCLWHAEKRMTTDSSYYRPR